MPHTTFHGREASYEVFGMCGVEVFTDVLLPFRPAPVYLKVGAPLSHGSNNKTLCRKLHFRAFWIILSA